MNTEGTHKALVRLGWITAIVYIAVGLVVGLLPSHWKETGAADQVLWVVFLAGGGLLLIAGLRSIERSPWLGAGLISLGGLAGVAALFWTIVVPLAAIALIVLSIMTASRMRKGSGESEAGGTTEG
jgi:di/tricarboxylate transporter